MDRPQTMTLVLLYHRRCAEEKATQATVREGLRECATRLSAVLEIAYAQRAAILRYDDSLHRLSYHVINGRYREVLEENGRRSRVR